MRSLAGRALLALVLVLTQLHICEATYVRDSGLVCQECLTIDDHGSDVSGIDKPHGDCHDCCEIRECETPQTSETPGPSQQFGFEFSILPDPFVLPHFVDGTVQWDLFPFTLGAPATGPPLALLTRGPPALFLAQPSAGR